MNIIHLLPSGLSKKLMLAMFCLMLAGAAVPVLAQNSDYQSSMDVSGSTTVTIEGFSIVPALTLGEPAAIFNLSAGRRLTFEPEALENNTALEDQ